MSFRIQIRDIRIIDEISEYGGMLSRRQIMSSHWPDSGSQRAMQKRLSKLKDAGYLDYPSRYQYRNYPIPEPIVWLGPLGALLAAEHRNIRVAEPASFSRDELRGLQRRLKEEGFLWLREPRWMSIRHELTCSHLRRHFERAINKRPNIELINWFHEGHFLTDMDIIEFSFKGRDGRSIARRKGIRPDSYFIFVDKDRQSRGMPATARYLLEVDMATHPNRRFVADKAFPGVAYIKSEAYKKRFESSDGIWLVVTKGEGRVKNLVKRVRDALKRDAAVFRFTTMEELAANDALSSKIWRVPGRDGLHALVTE